jgi:ABC-2 type transport system ATP-binding protein
MNELDPTLLLLLVPVVVVQVGLIILALRDLTRPGRRVRGESRVMWALIILFVSSFGAILYFLIGREEAGAPPPAGRPEPGEGPAAGAAGAARAAVGGSSADVPAEAAGMPAEAATAPAALPPGPSAVTCRGLSKRYGGTDGVLALDRLDLDVPEGSVFGLLGPNGAGKTTTLRMLVGLSRPTGGSATVAGVPLDGDGPRLASRIGFLDQDPRYYGWMTGRELVEMVGRLHGLDGEALRSAAAETLERVGLADALDRRVATYSGGMRQRLGLAQALVARPRLLVLDEPVSSLDPEGRRDLLALIAELRSSCTVLFSTHVLSDVERVCDRIAILDHGRLVTEGPLDALLERYALPVYRLDPEPGQDPAVDALAERIRGADWTTDVRREHGFLRVTVSDPGRAGRELLPAVVEAGVALAGFERVRPTLEDVFLRLVGRGDGPEAGR